MLGLFNIADDLYVVKFKNSLVSENVYYVVFYIEMKRGMKREWERANGNFIKLYSTKTYLHMHNVKFMIGWGVCF